MQIFHPIKVAEVRRETDECVSVKLDIPEDLKSDFDYIQGQYITLQTIIDGEEVRRSYSLCSSPLDDEWRVAIKKLQGGVFSTFANEKLKAGDTLEAMAPQGRFHCDLDPNRQATYVFFAAGSGITPIISTIKTILRKEPNSLVILYYGNKDVNSIIFKEELEDLKNQYLGRFTMHFVLSRQEQESDWFNGHLNTEKLKQYARVFFNAKEVEAFFICGPQPMLLELREGLLDMGVDKPRIHFELFTTFDDKDRKKEKEEIKKYKGKVANVELTLDGKSMNLVVPFGGPSILEAALAKGADLPYACKGGVCCTCKARLMSGKVEMTVHYGLEDDEIERGYILTCQSHPRTEKLEVDFDQ